MGIRSLFDITLFKMNHDLLVPSLGQSLGMVASISEVQAGMV